MPKLFTTTEAANKLGVTQRRVQQLTTAPCPTCRGKGCKRCKQTGKYLPWQSGGRSGGGEIKLIPKWALELPDIQARPEGRPPALPNVTLERTGDGVYTVSATLSGMVVGEVRRESRHKWLWRREGAEGDEGDEGTRENAIKALLVSRE